MIKSLFLIFLLGVSFVPALTIGDGDNSSVERHKVTSLPGAVDGTLPGFARLKLRLKPVVHDITRALKKAENFGHLFELVSKTAEYYVNLLNGCKCLPFTAI